MARNPVADEELQQDVKAYYDNSGNKSNAALARGLRRQTYNDRLKMAEQRLGVTIGKVAAGRLKAMQAKVLKLPRRGHVKRYILTSVQNNTHLHPGFNNLLAYVDWLDGLERSSCKLMIGTYSYDVNSYGAKAVKRGKTKDQDKELWYSPEAEPFISDESIELAPGLIWCGEQNILPTASHPLNRFEDYNGRKSNIVPHSKIAMESVASMADEATKFNYSTGTVTQMNYIQKRAGIIAERKHSYGAAIVEVDHGGNWWVRQLNIDDDAIMDVGPRGYSGVHVHAGVVRARPVTENIYWGDTHASEIEGWVRELAWGEGGMLDTLRSRHQVSGDVFSMNSRGHHEIGDFHQSYRRHVEGAEKVESEVQLTTDLVNGSWRDWCETVIVPSNHHRHLDRWLNEADFRKDPVNAKYFLQLQWHLLDAIDRGDRGFNVLEWAMRNCGLVDSVRFLAEDESFIIAGVENGLHGDLGPNGARGSTINLTKLGRRVNKGHDHRATIRDNVYSAGVCSLKFSYTKGPSSHSVSHIVTYENGERAILTMWANKWRA